MFKAEGTVCRCQVLTKKTVCSRRSMQLEHNDQGESRDDEKEVGKDRSGKSLVC